MSGENRITVGLPKVAGIYTLDPLPHAAWSGLVAISVFSVLSFIATGGCLVFLTYRTVRWKRFYTTFIGFNQYFFLIYLLILSDFFKIWAFLVSLHWLQIDEIASQTTACSVQGYLMQTGDLAMATWVFGMAIHSFLAVWRGRLFSFSAFATATVIGWVLILILTIVGPTTHGSDFWVRTGSWCWISEKYELTRRCTQYIWVTICQIGQFAIFISLICVGRRRMSAASGADNSSVALSASRLASIMSWYALVYILLNIPLQSGQISSGHNAFGYNSFAGSISALTGLAHTILYYYTREEILTSTFDIPASSPRTRGFSDAGSDNSNPKRGPTRPWGGPDGNFAFPAKPTRTFSGRENSASSSPIGGGHGHGIPHELATIEPNSPSKRTTKESAFEVTVEQNPWEARNRSSSPDLHNQKPAQVWHAI